jgi:hypothetical protein
LWIYERKNKVEPSKEGDKGVFDGFEKKQTIRSGNSHPKTLEGIQMPQTV